MVSQDHAGSEPPPEEYVRNIDLRAWNLAIDLERLAYTRPDAFKELLKEIAKGDLSLYRSLLWRWGIR